MAKPAARSETALIECLRTTLAAGGAGGRPDRVPFGDDMAELTGEGGWLWTVDMLMDGVDFRSTQHDWAQIGRKAMAVNLSDCAAMAVRPAAALCAVALNNRLSLDDAAALVRGAHALGVAYQCPVVGGDTNSWDAPTVISVSIAGRPAPGCRPVRRDGARPGDALYVSGGLGGSLLGRHLTFEPRVTLALELNSRCPPHAMIDISDGLALDLHRMCEASGCAAVLDEAALEQVSHADARQMAARDGRPARDHALFDGEDFELLVAAAPDASAAVLAELRLQRLGSFEAGAGVYRADAAGRRSPVPRAGWEHFR